MKGGSILRTAPLNKPRKGTSSEKQKCNPNPSARSQIAKVPRSAKPSHEGTLLKYSTDSPSIPKTRWNCSDSSKGHIFTFQLFAQAHFFQGNSFLRIGNRFKRIPGTKPTISTVEKVEFVFAIIMNT